MTLDHLVVLHAILDGPELRGGIEPVAHRPLARFFGKRLAQRVVDLLVRVDALDGHAHLAAVHEACEEQLRRDDLRVDVVEHDGRIVAAQLERHALQRARRAGHHLLARRDGAGERDLVDARMLGHPLAQRIAAGEDVDHAARKHVPQQLTDLQRAERRVRGGLQDNRVAGVERRHERPGREIDGRVPRRDDARDAQRDITQLDALLRIVDDQSRCYRSGSWVMPSD